MEFNAGYKSQKLRLLQIYIRKNVTRFTTSEWQFLFIMRIHSSHPIKNRYTCAHVPSNVAPEKLGEQ